MSKCIYFSLLVILYIGRTNTNSPQIPDRIKNLDNLFVIYGQAEPAMELQIYRDNTFGNTEDILVGRMGDIVVDDAGKVFIGDGPQNIIHVFKSDGSYLTHLGRKGRGPGEFYSSPNLTIMLDQLYVYDPMQLRITVYTLDSLTVSDTKNLYRINQSSIEKIESFTIRQLFVISENRFLVSFGPTLISDPTSPGYNLDDLHRLYYFMDKEGRILSDKIFEQRDIEFLTTSVDGKVRSMTGFKFTAKPLIAVSDQGNIYSARTDEFLITVRGPTGKYLRTYYCPYEEVRLTRKDAINSEDLEVRKRIVKNANLPKTWPALNDLLIDDKNRLWVSTIVANSEVYQWWVLNTSGKLLARFRWPREKPIEDIKNGKIYTRETDEETGLQKIVSYDIDITES